ncbi:hypothetical protein HZH66_001990 [Vespula vulgaris]|uniref:Uncharacterized protein n=1 Tax=Vespula vulgaris TaxID=7454 RepID=A0A834KJ11_VESVU|nr:hypothetical protein HZH66_001990 [Vespula vulgaris]
MQFTSVHFAWTDILAKFFQRYIGAAFGARIDTSTRSSLLLLPIEDELIKKKRENLGLEKCIKDRGSVTLAILRCDRGIVVLSTKKKTTRTESNLPSIFIRTFPTCIQSR